MIASLSDAQALAAIVVALVTGAGGLYLLRSRRKLTEASTVESLTRAAMSLVEPLQAEVGSLRERVLKQEGKLEVQDGAILELRQKHEDCLQREAEARGRLEALERANGG